MSNIPPSPTPTAIASEKSSSTATNDKSCHKSDSATVALAPSDSSCSTRSYLYAVLMGLLTSSCCIIQLVLNAFSIGCAGFSVLTPFRPFFVSLSIAMIVYNIFQYGRSRPLQTLITVLIVATLSISPELVAHKNHGGQLMPSSAWWSSSPLTSFWNIKTSFWPTTPSSSFGSEIKCSTNVDPSAGNSACSADDASSSLSSSILDSVPHHPVSPNQEAHSASTTSKHHDLHKRPLLDVYKVRVEGMKCEACANRLQRAFQAQPGIQKCTVYFKDKHLYLWATSSEESNWTESLIKQVIAGVDFKYRATLLAQGSAESTDETPTI
ncbi:hypothetical protein BGW42_006681 [Actinomortierella wolfii]|nr:hypothetical protein BGW42_006681 [Actinomortierella wolfii]